MQRYSAQHSRLVLAMLVRLVAQNQADEIAGRPGASICHARMKHIPCNTRRLLPVIEEAISGEEQEERENPSK